MIGRKARTKPRTSRKGQTAIESIILIGFVILLTLPVMLIFFSVDRATPALAQARASVQIMADNANKVYTQGEGAQVITTIAIPQYCKNVTVRRTSTGGEIIFTMVTKDGEVEVYQKTYAPLQDGELFIDRRSPGDEYLTPGLQRIKFSLVSSPGGGAGGAKVVKIEPY